MSYVVRAAANVPMLAFTSFIVGAALVNAGTCDSSMMQLGIEGPTKGQPSEVPSQRAEACALIKRDSSTNVDEGYDDHYRGWYDVQGCGQCLDYCRWVGLSGSGGDPAKQTESGKSYWSCDLAGSGDPYTAKAHFGTKFEHKKCAGVSSTVGEGAAKTLTRKEREKMRMKLRSQKKKVCAQAKRSSIDLDAGYEDEYRGWYDVQGCGHCLDYCRWVGHSGSGGDPSLRTQRGTLSKKGGSYWSCDLAGSSNPYTAAGYFGTKFERKKCAGVNLTVGEGDAKRKHDLDAKRQHACAQGKRDSTEDVDEGYDDHYRGWYDVQGCGQCLDYCRWVGDSGSGGDPAKRTESGKSYWSCDLAGSGDPYTNQGHFGTKFEHKKCAGVSSTVGEGDAKTRKEHEMQKKKVCAQGKRSSTDLDAGYEDDYRGWYDVQGCGQCLDYCRWVGHSGSGGDPAERTRAGTLSKKGGSYWSCDLAGSGDPYTKEGRFGTSFPHKRCAGVNSSVGEGSVPAGGD